MTDATVAILLAAGKGTRMRSALPKPLVPLQGLPLLRHMTDNLEKAGVERIIIVVGHQADRVEAALGPGFVYVRQEPQLGTGHAVSLCREAVGEADEVLVFVGDSPLLRAASVRALLAHHRTTGASATFLTALFPPGYPYGRVLRDLNGRITGCIEERWATPEQFVIRELLTSHYAFHGPDLWACLEAIGPRAETGETYLTDVLAEMAARDLPVEAVRRNDWSELVGLNTPEEVAWAAGILEARLAR